MFIRQMHMPQGTDRATLGHTLFPMLSSRTGFSTLISDMEERHHLFAESLKSSKEEDSKQIASSLALKFPAFICETKLDGERMIVHIQNGKVTMQVNTVVSKSCLMLIDLLTDILMNDCRPEMETGTGKKAMHTIHYSFLSNEYTNFN